MVLSLSPIYHFARTATLCISTIAAVLGWESQASAQDALAPTPATSTSTSTYTTTSTPSEQLAKDLREEVLSLAVTVVDMAGRQETVAIPVTVYRPAGQGPFPLVVFNHGRSASPAKRAQMLRSRPEVLARYLVAKGFVVMAPTRVGYGASAANALAAGQAVFDPEQAGACNVFNVQPMVRALGDQVLATVDWARTLAYVDASRWLVVGQSVGGLASIATVARHPSGLVGAINFSGGAGGDPQISPMLPCNPKVIYTYLQQSAQALAQSTSAASPSASMLWLYWQNDKFWGQSNPKAWHSAWVEGWQMGWAKSAGAQQGDTEPAQAQDVGGTVQLVSLPPAGADGHLGMDRDMAHWLPVVDAYLAQLGFDKDASIKRPPPSGYAALEDVGKVPLSAATRERVYAQFLQMKPPRALAIGEQGGWGYSQGDYALGRALGNCQRFGQRCKLYAVDNDVVWVK